MFVRGSGSGHSLAQIYLESYFVMLPRTARAGLAARRQFHQSCVALAKPKTQKSSKAIAKVVLAPQPKDVSAEKIANDALALFFLSRRSSLGLTKGKAAQTRHYGTFAFIDKLVLKSENTEGKSPRSTEDREKSRAPEEREKDASELGQNRKESQSERKIDASDKMEDQSKDNKERKEEQLPGGNNGGLTPGQSFLLLVVSAILYAMTSSTTSNLSQKEITWQEFRNSFLDKHLVDRLIVVNRSKVRIVLKGDTTGTTPPQAAQYSYYFSIGSVEAFERKLDAVQDELEIQPSERIPVAYHEEVSALNTILTFAPTILLVSFIWWMSRRANSGAAGGGGIFGIGKSRAKLFNHDTEVKVRFQD
ncbi:10835_t:CDS:2, partial [Acaulospora colombiana]